MPIAKRVSAAVLSLSALACGFAAQAADDTAAPVAATPETAAPVERPNPLGAKPIDSGALAKSRGGAQVLNDMKLKGTVADNQARNVVTGNNSISDGAFSNANGMPMVVQNSGNNVLIQSATIVNVQLK